MIFSSLRFDDGVHVAPSSLQMSEEALLGVVWQTKVERKKRGTRFAVPKCSVAGRDWLDEGWKIFQPLVSERDYFIWGAREREAVHSNSYHIQPQSSMAQALLAQSPRRVSQVQHHPR